jgi:hypothetical protein
VALHPSRRSQILLALQQMAPVFNGAGYRVRFVYPQSNTKAATYLKAVFAEAGVTLGMGAVILNNEPDGRPRIIASQRSYQFAVTVASAIAPLIEVPVVVSKRDEETDIAILLDGAFQYSAEGQIVPKG